MILESLDAPQVLREDVKNLRVVSCCFCSSRQSQPTLLRCSWSCAVGKRMVLQQLGGCRFDTERVWAIAESPKKGAAPKSRDFRGRGHTWPDPWIVDLLTMITSLRVYIFSISCGNPRKKRISFEGDPKQIQVLAQGQLHQRSLGATDAHWLFLNESKWKAKEAVVVPGTNGIEWVDSTLTKMHSFFSVSLSCGGSGTTIVPMVLQDPGSCSNCHTEWNFYHCLPGLQSTINMSEKWPKNKDTIRYVYNQVWPSGLERALILTRKKRLCSCIGLFLLTQKSTSIRSSGSAAWPGVQWLTQSKTLICFHSGNKKQ